MREKREQLSLRNKNRENLSYMIFMKAERGNKGISEKKDARLGGEDGKLFAL